jgi:hypothetical protein
MPGVSAATVEKLVTPAASRSAPLIAVMLIGVFSTVESRFSAVTTISVSESAAGAAATSVWAPAGNDPKHAAAVDAAKAST